MDFFLYLIRLGVAKSLLGWICVFNTLAFWRVLGFFRTTPFFKHFQIHQKRRALQRKAGIQQNLPRPKEKMQYCTVICLKLILKMIIKSMEAVQMSGSCGLLKFI